MNYHETCQLYVDKQKERQFVEDHIKCILWKF